MADTNGTAFNATTERGFSPTTFFDEIFAFLPKLVADPQRAIEAEPHLAGALVGLIIFPSLLLALLHNVLAGGKRTVNALDNWVAKSLVEEAEGWAKDAANAPVTETPWEIGVTNTAVAVAEDGNLRTFEAAEGGKKVTAAFIAAAIVKAISAPSQELKVQRPKIVSFLHSRQCSPRDIKDVGKKLELYGIRVDTAEALEAELAPYYEKRKADMAKGPQIPLVLPTSPVGPAPAGEKPQFGPQPNRGCFTCKKEIDGKASQCSACKAMIYCSAECSKKDWPQHKPICPGFKANMQRVDKEKLHDLPFDFYNSEKQLASYNQVAFLAQKDVHNVGVFRRLCGCYSHLQYGELAAVHIQQMQSGQLADPLERFKLLGLSNELFPLSAPYPEGYNVREIDSWKKYYELKKLSMDDPAALVLEVPLTVWHILNKFVLDKLETKPDGRRALTIHMAGVEKEADLCTLFELLLSLIPKTDIALHMISPSVSSRVPPQHATIGIRNEQMDSTILITLRESLYGEPHITGDAYKAEGLPFGTGKPDVVIIMNSSLISSPSWLPTVRLLIENRQKTILTEQMEHTVDMIAKQLDLIGCPLTVKPEVNPFRQPVYQWKKDTNLPGWSNAFIYGIF
ncbi:uncharacterized protein EV422DRAFT_387526 [Fimicolochytrium jonesii]|uniref:uncharacterized protein n=1 Tax=Fimicolochytrium jonesii TaxID=1396493 RepID=UPI0022FE7F30|nr:uncharacterized protein EV422DRAFT_387526 [Fimicolochytrium jonesii]KAI8822995.1 hypothetical protein EV422DRAFT_387526 [Fimicolochytrium jonesii]